MNTNANQQVFTVKNVMRVLSVLCVIIFFCPTFLVSCSGADLEISAMNAATGIRDEGVTYVKPYPIMWVALIIPVMMLIFMFLKNLADKKLAISTLALSVIDIITWFMFMASVKKIAEENFCEARPTAWFYINLLALIGLIGLSAMLLNSAKSGVSIGMTSAAMAATGIATGVGAAATTPGASAAAPASMGFCAKCGKPLKPGTKFCTSCGETVPESVIAEYEASQKNPQMTPQTAAPKFCTKCGAQIPAGNSFCTACGAKVE